MAFDRVEQDEIITKLTQLKIDEKYLLVIENIYWEQTAAMQVNGEISSFKKIKHGVRQGYIYVCSPQTFSLATVKLCKT